MPIVNDLIDIDPTELVKARKRYGWSQYTLAEQSGVSRSFISEIEGGSKNPRRRVAVAIAAALDLPLERLVV